MGVEYSVNVVAGQIRVPVNDLLTYVFLPVGTTVSVGNDWWTSTTNLLAGRTVTSKSGHAATYVNDGSFASNQLTDDPTVYSDKSIPSIFSTVTTRPATGFALLTAGPAWQTAGCSLADFSISVNGHEVYRYECASAVSVPIPSASIENNSDRTGFTSWWTGPFGWLVKVPIPAGNVTLTINRTSYGGQPDQIGSLGYGDKKVIENGSQLVQLAEWQLLA